MEPAEPKLEPVMVKLDFITGDDEVLDSEVMTGARFTSYENVNVAD